MKILRFLLMIVGIFLMLGVVGQNDYETFQQIVHVDITPTPLGQIIALGAIGAVLTLGGLFLKKEG